MVLGSPIREDGTENGTGGNSDFQGAIRESRRTDQVRLTFVFDCSRPARLEISELLHCVQTPRRPGCLASYPRYYLAIYFITSLTNLNLLS